MALLGILATGVTVETSEVTASGVASYCSSIGAVQSADGAAYCVTTFTASTTWTPPAGVVSVEYLVVGGGGGGKNASAGVIQERGGAGGAVVTGSATLSGDPVTVVVGAGGSGNASGSASSIAWSGSATITAAGGTVGAGPAGAGVDGPTSSITGTAVVYGSSGGKAPNFAGGSGAGRGANSSTNNCTGGGSAASNRGGGGGGGDRCTIDFGHGASYSYGIGGAGGSGIVIVRWAAFSIGSFVPAASPTNSADSVDFTLTFTGDVDPASLTADDFGFSNTQTATGCSVTGVVATSAATFTVTVGGCSEGTVVPRILTNAAVSSGGVSGPGADTDAAPMTIDRTAPSAPSMTIGAGTSSGPTLIDGGVTVEDGIGFTSGPSSSDTSPVTYSCTLDGGAVQTPCPSNFGPLTDGEHTLTVWATDGAGNESSQVTHSWIQVGPPPLALAPSSDTGASDSDRLTGDDTPTIALDGLAEGTSVTLRAQAPGQTDVTCTFTVTATDRTCALSLPIDGEWTVQSQVTDQQGAPSAWSTALSITVDTAAPSAPDGIDLAAGSDTGTSSTDDLTADTTPRIDVTGGTTGDTATVIATPAGGGTAVSCTFVVGADTGCDLPELGDGTWGVTATFTDPAGNVSAVGPTPGIDIEVDASVPGAGSPVLTMSSDTGTSSSDGITSVTSPTAEVSGLTPGDDVTITATDGVDTVTCSFSATASTQGCVLIGLTDGSWTITSTVTDPAGNVASTGPSSIEIDTTAPAAPTAPDLLGPSDSGTANDDDVTSDTTPAIDGGGTDGDLVSVTATPVGGGASVTCQYVRTASVRSCDLPALSDGEWSVTATVTDPAGNVSASGPATVLTVDTTAPSVPAIPDLPAVGDSGVDDADDITALTSFPIQIAGGLVTGDEVTVSATDGTRTVTCSFVASPTASSCTLSGLTDGEWEVTATTADMAGNRSAVSGSLDIVVRPTAPSAPTASVDGAESVGDVHRLGADSAIVRVDGPVTGDAVTVSATDGTRIVRCTFTASADTDGCALTGLDSGDWIITTTVTDPLGRSASSDMTLVVIPGDPGAGGVVAGTHASCPLGLTAAPVTVVCEDWVAESAASLPSTGGVDGVAPLVLVVALGALAVMLGGRRAPLTAVS